MGWSSSSIGCPKSPQGIRSSRRFPLQLPPSLTVLDHTGRQQMGHNRTPPKAGLAPGSAFPTAEFEGQNRVAHRKTASRGPTTTHLRSYLRFILVGPLSYGSHRSGHPTTSPESRVTQSCARSAKRGGSLLNLIPTESDAFDIHRVEHENAFCEGLSSGMKVGEGPRIHTTAQSPVPVPAWRPKARTFIPKAH
jgi:hypothetical protein